MPVGKLKFERLTILLHILGWAILFCFPFFGRDTFTWRFILKSAFHISLLASFFYLNLFVLIPRLLFRKKTGAYIVTVLVCMAFIIAMNECFDEQWHQNPKHAHSLPQHPHPPPRHGGNRMIFPLISSLMVLGISTSLKTVSEYQKKEKLQKETETEKLNSELAFLKSQINPHFLFNTLNNLYSLARSGSEQTAPAVMKLSELMRYMLEDTEGQKVSLQKELEYIQNYLELQKLRLNDSVKVELQVEGDFKNKKIEPLLLIPFIENAFKHGISYATSSYIRISLVCNGEQLIFRQENSIGSRDAERDEVSGIGMKNVQKRLELLYPRAHALLIEQDENRYRVQLTIDL